MFKHNDEPRDEFLDTVQDIISCISYKDPEIWHIRAARDLTDPAGRVYIQIHHWRRDSTAANQYQAGWGQGGKRYLSPHMVEGEIVRQVFSALLAYEEHEVREWFKWNDRAVFGPHISVAALWEVSGRLEVRE